jgi:hypothetical protein
MVLLPNGRINPDNNKTKERLVSKQYKQALAIDYIHKSILSFNVK